MCCAEQMRQVAGKVGLKMVSLWSNVLVSPVQRNTDRQKAEVSSCRSLLTDVRPSVCVYYSVPRIYCSFLCVSSIRVGNDLINEITDFIDLCVDA